MALKARPPKLDCYDYVRRYYRVPAFIGVGVQVRGRTGVIVAAKHSLHYVHILLDGDKRSDVYHPTDGIDYVISLGEDQAVVTTKDGRVVIREMGPTC